MPPDKRKLKRARLIERVRTVEKSRSALAASEAEALRERLFGVAERTRSLARYYAEKDDALTGMDLRSGKAMQDQLEHLVAVSSKQAAEAEKRSDATLGDLAAAERRRKRAFEDRRDLVNAIVSHLSQP